MTKKNHIISTLLTVFFIILSLIWLYPIFAVALNSFKANAAVNMDPFALPTAETFMGWDNYIKGMTFGNYPFLKSVFYSVELALYIHGCMVYRTSKQRIFKTYVYVMCVFHDRSIPDGNVHFVQYSG